MNRYQKIALFSSLVFGFFVQGLTQVKAQIETPSFPTCSNPQGTLKVSYENGTHGIAGSPSQFSGSDSVYTINNKTLIQCFCSEDGQGIQTNWWKINSLTQDEIDTLKKLGWIFVPSGSAWGLDSSPYMAKNSDYACSTTDNQNDNGTGGQVLGASSVLGLAATGNSLFIYSLLILGLASILLGKILHRDSK